MEKRVHLKGRLQELSDYAKGSDTVADIGCDHGRLSVSLLQTGAANTVYACDISRDSLEKARALRDKCGLTDKMHICLTDGLHNLPSQPDTVIIAGMGGILISEILSAVPDVAKCAERIIMQPMRTVSQLRKFLHTSGYHITREQLCKDAGRIYQLILAKYVGEMQDFSILPKGFYEFGELMIKNRDPLLPELIMRMRRELSEAKERAEKNGAELTVLTEKLKILEETAHEM